MAFLSQLFVSSDDETWAENYLTNSSYRFSSLINVGIGANYWKVYGQKLGEAHRNGDILLRYKSYCPEKAEIEVTQVWKLEERYLQFIADAGRRADVENAFTQHGFSIQRHFANIESSDINKIIDSKMGSAVIWQYVDKKFLRQDMVLGDPLKRAYNEHS